MKINSTIIFQDYFYHWSATLIASVQYLIQLKKISILNTAASSLTVIYSKPVLKSELDTLEKKMQDLDFIIKIKNSKIVFT